MLILKITLSTDFVSKKILKKYLNNRAKKDDEIKFDKIDRNSKSDDCKKFKRLFYMLNRAISYFTPGT